MARHGHASADTRHGSRDRFILLVGRDIDLERDTKMHAGAATYPSGKCTNNFWTITAGHMPCNSSQEWRFSTGGRK